MRLALRSTNEKSSHRLPAQGTILIVDDNHEDKYFLVWALKTLNLNSPTQVLSSGEEAIAYLSGKPPFHDRLRYPMPHLMLLDLKMPNLDGFAVLKWVKSQPALDGLNVVVVSGSNRDSDIVKARTLGAKDYIIKPIETLDLVDAVREVTFRWLG